MELRLVHGICVAFGAEDACRSYCKDDDGSFFVAPYLQGEQHIRFDLPGHLPFAIGDVDPTGPFVHVFDQASLEIVMRERDTITDFTRYLQQREQLIRSKSLMISPSEAEMVANYMLTDGPDGHRFPSPRDIGAADDFKMSFVQGEYQAFKNSPKYAAMQAQRKESYVWDRLIKMYTGPVLAGTTESILDIGPSVDLSERALRFMASESRLMRFGFSQGIAEALRGFQDSGLDRFARIFMRQGTKSSDLAYIFMILAYPKGGLEGGYAQYRHTRTIMLETYCYVFLQKYPTYKTAVGIGVDAPGGEGSSEDLMVIEAPVWSEKLLKDLEDRRAHFEIFEVGKVKKYGVSYQEYPEVHNASKNTGLNRQERRKASKRARLGRH